MFAVCALNHWTMHEIVELHRLTDVECIQYLLQLDTESRRVAKLHSPFTKGGGGQHFLTNYLGLLLATRGWEPADFTKLRR